MALPIFPGRLQPSIVGRSELNFRVRDGNGWTLALISTNCCIAISVLLLRILCLSGLTIVWTILLSFVIYLVLLLITGTLKRKDFKL